MTAPGSLEECLEGLDLVDHHVHGALRVAPSREGFESMINEGFPGVPEGDLDPWQSQLGFAIRRWCAPLLDLPIHADPADYWARRCRLGEAEVNRRFLSAAGVGAWLVDTGHLGDTVLGVDGMAAVAGTAHEIVRLESLGERLLAGGVSPSDYAAAFRERLHETLQTAVGCKSILAYRCGFDIDLSRPSDADVRRAVADWREHGADGRMTDPVLLRFGLHESLETGKPLQLHVGFGDRDLDLRRVDPLLLRPFLLAAEHREIPVMLLHCYPYEREAGYLAQAYRNVYMDVGLAVNYLGSRSDSVIANGLELAPFRKILYSSDAWGPAELHFLGAMLWRNGLARVLGRWVERGEWSADDACRVARLIGSGNARRVYRLE
jgi:predicted TIM-barrel fold metal-dependent hydrolase